jgi:CMP-N-acetylneuraminic acid synthetase
VDFHKEYSLETKSIKDKNFKLYSKKELISYITEKAEDNDMNT